MALPEAVFASRLARTPFRPHHVLPRCPHTHLTAARAAGNTTISSSSSSSSVATNGANSSREGQPLTAWLAGLQLMEQQYSVAGRVLRLVAPLDVDVVMDMYIKRGTDGDPYWARVWPSAICLAQQLLQRPELVAGKCVADLGAGLGVAGIAAAWAGAAEVVLLDREPLALQCGLISAAASGVGGVQGLDAAQVQWGSPATAGAAPSSSSCSSSAGQGPTSRQPPAAEVLQLTEVYLQQRSQQQQASSPTPSTSHASSSSSSSSSAALQQLLQRHQHQQQQPNSTVFRAATFDWSSSSSPPQLFDVVLACDVLYEESAVEAVAAVVPQLLRPGPGALLLLADPPNRTATNRDRFVELLAAGGRPAGLLLEESGVYDCAVSQLDPEIVGGVKEENVAVQFMAFRAAVGNDTIGIKAG